MVRALATEVSAELTRVVGPDLGALRPLFDPRCPNHPMLFAALLGRAPAVAIVDSRESPSNAVLRTHYGPTFVARGTDVGFAREAIERLRREGTVEVVVADGESAPVGAHPDGRTDRIAFDNLPSGPRALAPLLARSPVDCIVRVMDLDILRRCLWHREVIAALADEEAFLREGIGLCLMRGDEILCEAYGLFRGEGTVEIGSITRPDARGRGLSPILCAHVVTTCRSGGYEAYGSCDIDNIASRRVAEKLGFRRSTRYSFWTYPAIGS